MKEKTCQPLPFVLSTLLFILLLNGTALASSGGGIIWSKNYSRPGLQEAISSVLDPQGNIIVTGFTEENQGDYLTVKFDKSGQNIAWAVPFDKNGKEDRPTAVAVDPAGDVVVTGYVFTQTGYDIHTIKYCGTTRLPECANGGDLLWQHTYAAPFGGDDFATAISTDTAGNVYVAGFTQGANGDDFLVIKYGPGGPDAGGNPLWSRTLDGPAHSHDRITSIAVGANLVAVVGDSYNGNDFDILAATWTPDGVPGNAIRYDGGEGNDFSRRVTIDTNGNVIFGGTRLLASNTDFYFASFNPTNGQENWHQSYDNGSADDLRDLTVDASGDVYVTGTTFSGTTETYVGRYAAADGHKIWGAVPYSSGIDDTDIPTKIAIDPSGDLFIAGHRQKGLTGDDDFMVLKYNRQNGQFLWDSFFNGPANRDDQAVGIGLDSGGRLFVAGWSDRTLPLGGSSQTVTTATVNTVTVSGAGWTIDHWKNCEIIFLSGPLAGYSRKISANSGDTLTFSPDLPEAPAGGTTFRIAADNADGGSSDTVSVPSTSTLVDNSQNWTADQWIGYRLVIISGANSGEFRTISANTATSLTVSPAFTSPPTAGDLYNLMPPTDYDYFALEMDPGLLNPPDSLTATTVSETSIDLVWNQNSANEEGFEIFRKAGELDPWPTTPIATTGVDVTTYTDSGLTPHTRYFYRVRAYNSTLGINSHYSNTASALTTVANYQPPAMQYLFDSTFNNDDYATAIAAGPDNNPVVTGYSYEDMGMSYDYYTVKIDRLTGQELWHGRYDDPDGEVDIATCITVNSANETFVSGYSSLAGANGNTNDICTLKYDAAGPPAFGPPHAWQVAYNGPGASDDRSVAVETAIDGSGNIFVSGYGRNAAGDDDIYLLKYAPDGTLIWPAGSPEFPVPYDGGGNDYPAAMAIDHNGDVIIVGETFVSGNDYDILVRKYKGSDGSEVWKRIIDYSGGWDVGNDLAIGSNNDVYIVGEVTNAAGDIDGYLMRLSASSGQDVWSGPVILNGPANGDDSYSEIELDINDNQIVAAGTVLTAAGNHDFITNRYTPDGQPVWSKLLDRPAEDDFAQAMAMDPSGNVCLAGKSENGGLTSDVIAVKYNYKGEILGSTYFDRGASEEISRAAAARSGEIWLAGYSVNSSNNADYLVMACNGDDLMAPSPFTAAANYVHVDLFWQENVPDADGYNLRKQPGSCATADPAAWINLPSQALGTNTYTDANLAPNDTFCYQIQAYRGAETSRWIELTVTTTDPPAPADFTATALDSTRVRLQWTDNIVNEEGFRLSRCDNGVCAQDSDFTVTFPDLAPGTTSFEDKSACQGKSYTYRLISFSSQWAAYDYAYASATTPAKQAPSILSATPVSEGRIDLAWSDSNSDEDAFVIYSCIDPGSGCTPANPLTVEAPEGSVLDLKMNETAWVVGNSDARDSSGHGHNGTVYGTTTPGRFDGADDYLDIGLIPELAGVGNFSAELRFRRAADHQETVTNHGTHNVLVAQSSAIESDHFEVGTSGGDIEIFIRDQVNGEQFFTVPAGITDGQWYHLAVTYDAADANELKVYLDGALIWQTDLCDGNLAISDVTPWTVGLARPDGSTDNLWGDFEGEIDRLTLYDRTLSPSEVNRFASDSNLPLSASVEPLIPNTTYRFWVTAKKTAPTSCNSGWETDEVLADAAASMSATTLDITSGSGQEPILDSATVDPANPTTNVDLAFTDRSGTEEKFIIERCNGDCSGGFTADPAFIASAASGQNSYTDDSACSGTYSYQILAARESDPIWTSGPSNILVATTSTPVGPSALQPPTMLNESEIRLDFTDNSSDESGFEVQRCTGAGCAFVDYPTDQTVTLSAPPHNGTGPASFIDTTAQPDMFYRYRVRARKDTGCTWTTAFSNVVEQDTAIGQIGTINLTGAAANTTQIDLAWNDITSHEGDYLLERCDQADCSSWQTDATIPLPPNSESATDSSAAVCTNSTHSYRVKAVNNGLSLGRGGCFSKRSAISNISPFIPGRVTEITIPYDPAMRADFADLRLYQFTDASETSGNEIPHWLVKKTDSTSAVIWFIAPATPDNIYLYFGNPAAADSSDGNAVTTFFDNFPGKVIDSGKWQENDSLYADKIRQDDGLLLRYDGRSEWTDVVGRSLFDRSQGDLTLYVQATFHNTQTGAIDIGWFEDNIASKSVSDMVHAMQNSNNMIYLVREQNTTAYARDSSNHYSYFTYEVPYEFKIVAKKDGGAQYFIRGGEGTAHSYPSWHLVFDTSGNYTPLNSTNPLRPAIFSYSQDADISAVAAFSGEVNEASANLALATDTGCAVMPGSWTVTSNQLGLTTPTITPPLITAGTALSESEAELSWDNQVSDYSGTVIRRCKHTATVDCSNDADFIDRADLAGIINAAGAAPLVKYEFEENLWNPLTNSVSDSSGNGINARPYGNVLASASGQINRGAAFNGKDSYIEIPGSGSMENVTDSSFTLAAWVMPAGLPPNTDHTNHTDENFAIITRPGYHTGIRYDSAGHFMVEVWNSANTWTGVASPLTYAPGTWHHVAEVVDDTAKTITLYVDGTPVANTSYTGALRDYGTTPFRIGAAALAGQNYSWFFRGRIDEAAIFNQALNADEIAAAMGAKGYYHDQGLALGTTYTYKIHNYKTAACPWTTTDSATWDITTLQPPPPAAFNANIVDSTTIDLDWQNQAGGTVGYNLERSMSPDGGASWNPYQPLATLDAATLAYTDRELYAGTGYKYRVQAFGGLANDGGGTWTAKQALSISNFIPDFQVKMTVTYDPAMKSDFSDLRFYDENTGMELPHWIESKSDGVSATVWFKTGDTNTISLVFGNPSATSDDDPAGVFELYDDFSGPSIDQDLWENQGATVSGGQAVITAPDNGGWRYLRSKKNFTGEMRVEVLMHTEGDKGGNGSHFSGLIDAGKAVPAAASTAFDRYTAHIGFGEGWCGDWYTCAEKSNGSNITYANIGIASNSTNSFDLSFVWKNGSSDFHATNLTTSATFNRLGDANYVPPVTTAMNIFLGADDINTAYGPLTLYVDKVWARKYAATEPSASHGATEAASFAAWQSVWTEAVPTPINTPQPPDPIMNSVAPASESGIDLAWDWTFSYNDQSNFELERCEGVSANCATFILAPDLTGYADHNLNNNTNYCYRIRAKKDGVTYPWTTGFSNQLCATTNSINGPSGLTAAANPADTNRIDLNWNDLYEGEDGYKIFRCTGDQSTCAQDIDFSQINPNAGANQTSYPDTGICSATTYSYRVKAYNDGAPLILSNSGGGDWTLRAPLTITPFIANNQTRVTVPWRAGMNTDFSDVRFYDETAGVELPYWLESKTDGVSAVFWFKSGTNNNVNLYFGNPLATYAGDPNQVFIEFAANQQDGSLASDLQNSDGFIVEADVSATNKSHGPQIDLDITGNGQEKTSLFYSNRLYRYGYNASGNVVSNVSGTFNNYPLNSFHKWQIRVNGQTLSYLFDGQSYIPGSTNNPILPTTIPLLYTHGTISFASHSVAGYCTYRNIFVRRYVASDPVVAIGNDESADAPAWESPFSTTATATSGSPTTPVLSDPATLVDEATVTLDWNDSNQDEDSFIVSRADWNGSACGTFTDLPATAGPDIFTYTDSGLVPNTTYCYRVRAHKNGAGSCPGWDGPESNVVQITTTVAGPDSLTANPSETTVVDLGWTNHTSSETGFTVKRCSGDTSACSDPLAANFDQIFTLAAAADSFSDTGVCPATTHTYAVQANGSGWNSAFSNLAQATTVSPTPPAGLTLAEVYNENADNRRIDLAWNDSNPDKSGIVIERCDLETSGDCSAGSGNFQVIGKVPTLDTFDTLIDPLVWSAWYQFGTADPSQVAPPLDVNDPSGYAKVYWDNGKAVLESSAVNLGETTFNQNRLVLNHPEIVGNGDFDLSFDYNLPLATGSETATSLQVPIRVQIKLGDDKVVLSHDINTSGHTYWWRINTGGTNHDGSLATTDTSGGFRVKRTGSTIELFVKQADGSWGAPVASQNDAQTGNDALWLLLLQYTRRDQAVVNKAEVDNFHLVTGSTAMGYHDQNSGLLPSHTYYYRVMSKRNSTSCTAWNNLYSNIEHELTNPAMPTLSGSAPGARQIDLSWTDAASDESGYSLERLLLNGKFIEIFRSGPGITTYTDTRGLDPGKSYTYRVRSFRDDGGIISYSAYSTAVIDTLSSGDNTTCVINQ